MSVAMKKGDYFRWSWKEMPNDSYELSYWCCAQIAGFDGDRLKDIYWGTGSGKSWTPEEAESRLNLTFIANQDDISTAPCDYYLYDKSDVVNLSHPNRHGSGLYIKKGARKSKRAIMEVVESNLERLERQIEFAKDRIEKNIKVRAELNGGADPEEAYICRVED